MNKYLENFDRELENLKIQLSMGHDEVADAFEQQKSRFKAYVDDVAESVDQYESEHAPKLKAKLDELRVQLALGRAESRDALEAQQEKLEETLEEAKREYAKVQAEGKGQIDEWEQAFHHRTELFRTYMDALRVQMHLGVKEAQEEYKEAQEEINEKVNEARRFWKERSQEGEQRWEEFSGEMTEAYNHVKSAMRKFFR